VTIKLQDSRGMIAAIRHDCRAGNLPRARRWMAEMAHGCWDESTPEQLELACVAVEVKLEECGL